MALTLVRPKLPADKLTELKNYLFTKWLRIKTARQEQVDGDYVKWSNAYEGIPLEEIRTVPFYKASNLVVPVIRIFIDTFVARTLNIIFTTRPLYVVEGLPSEMREGFEQYLNRKAWYDWNHYKVARDICFRGNKNGTCIYKVPYVERQTIDINAINDQSYSEETYTYYRGPDARPVPFEDIYLYPITKNNLCDVLIKLHRTRWVEEEARDKVESGDWTLPEGQSVDAYCRRSSDAKRQAQQSAAGVVDTTTQEFHAIEATLDYAILNDGKKYNVFVTFEEFTGDILDVYYNPFPRNLCIYIDYRPFPREDFIYGESLCNILGQAQEEASRIHNERRDNSTIASSVVFKRRNGSLLPNPSTNWYPGKVWDLDDMDDLDVINVGRNYEDMIQQEDYVFTLAEKLSGIGEIMQASSIGALSKRGIYNTGGTLGVIAEGNQRQDTNIRDVREVMTCLGMVSTKLQATFAPDDPLLDTLTREAADGARAALQFMTTDKARYIRFEVKASNAGANKEVQKANLMQIGQVLGEFGNQTMQMAQQLLNPQLNPGLRLVMTEVVTMQRNMAKRLLKAFDEWDAIDDLPDLDAAVSKTLGPGRSASGGGQPPAPGAASMPPNGGATAGAPGGLSAALLQQLASLPGAAGGPNGAPGVG